MTKGRRPVILLIHSTGGILANNEDQVIGWSLVNPGGGETGDIIMDGMEDTTGA